MYVSSTNTVGVMAILMTSRRSGGHIGITFWKLRGSLIPLAYMATPMRIERLRGYANRAVENSNLFRKIAQNTTEKDISTTG